MILISRFISQANCHAVAKGDATEILQCNRPLTFPYLQCYTSEQISLRRPSITFLDSAHHSQLFQNLNPSLYHHDPLFHHENIRPQQFHGWQ